MVCISCPLSSDCSATSAGTLAVSVCFDKNTMHKHIHDRSIAFMMTYKDLNEINAQIRVNKSKQGSVVKSINKNTNSHTTKEGVLNAV